MNRLQRKVFNNGERLVPYVSHDDIELVRHRSSYTFFHRVISSDLELGDATSDKITIADLGFGSGYGCALLSSIPGSQVTGVDIGEECEIHAKQYYPRANVNYVVEDLATYIPAASEFDYVVSRGVLEHVPDGMNLIEKIRFSRRAIIDVPYDERDGNEHHVIVGIKEDSFAHLKQCEIFYEDMEGRIFTATEKPNEPNLILLVLSAPGLPSIGSRFTFPIEPVRDTTLEVRSAIVPQGKRNYFDAPASMLQAAERAIREVDVVLDIGCGIRPMNYFRPNLHLMVEPWKEYADILTYRYSHDKSVIVLRIGALESLKTLGDNSVDSIFLLDVIEHLEKDVGKAVLKECERVARQQIVLFTPLGFMPQHVNDSEKDGWGLNGVAVQEHLSGWEPEEFDSNWTFFICENFHRFDFKGSDLKDVYGAFFAVRNFSHKEASVPSNLSDLHHPSAAELQLEKQNAESGELAARYQALLTEHNTLLNSRSLRLARLARRVLRLN